MHAPTQLLILVASTLYRQAWRALLVTQPDIEVVGAAGTVAELSGLQQSIQASTILVDLASPQPDQITQLKESSPDAGLLFLVPSYELSQILPLLRAGATGCISQDASVADLSRAIIAVGRGELFLPSHVVVRALSALARDEAPDTGLVESLTERECEVLGLLAQGLTNKDIAQTLFLSVRTVEAHLRNVYGKLSVHSRTEAALWAIGHGYGRKNR